MAEFHLFLDSQTITASNAARRGLLDVPTADENDTLFQRSETDKKWREHMEVKATKMAPWEKDPKIGIVTIQYKVTAEHYKKNANRIVTKSYFINTTAINEGQTHADYKRTMMNIGKLNSLIRACGVELEKDDNGKVAYHDYFNGEEKPLVGRRFWGIIRDYVWKNRNDEMQPDQDIDGFVEDK